MTADEARQVLRQLDSGALDNLPASARERLRRDALEVLGRIAEVVGVGVTRHGGRVVTVACRFCPPSRNGQPRVHVHGWPLDSAEPGWRRPHCMFAAGDYYIPAPGPQFES